MNHRHITALAALPLAAGALLLGGTAASASGTTSACSAAAPSATSAYPPAQCTATVSATVVVPGAPVTLQGTGFEPGNTIVVSIFSKERRLGTVVADADGVARATVKIPTDLAPGRHTLSLFDPEAGRQVTVPITISGSSSTGSAGTDSDDDGSLAFTGADDVVPLTAGGVALLLGAGGLAVVARRRRGTASAA